MNVIDALALSRLCIAAGHDAAQETFLFDVNHAGIMFQLFQSAATAHDPDRAPRTELAADQDGANISQQALPLRET